MRWSTVVPVSTREVGKLHSMCMSALPRHSERAHAYLESQQYSRANPEIYASNAGVPPANDVAHAEHDASSADPPPANVLVQSGINGADAVAQIRVPTSSLEIVPSASNNGSAAKVRDDNLYRTLDNLIRNHSETNSDEVQTLLRRHPNLDLNIDWTSEYWVPGELPLHLACLFREEQIVEHLLAAGANPETFCGYGRNALQCAAYHDVLDLKILNWLIERYKDIEAKKVYINLPDQDGGLMATHYVAACPSRKLEGFWALEGADWTLKNAGGETPFDVAARHGHWIITAQLARKQWGIKDVEFKTDAYFGSYQWTQVNLQNTTYIRHFVRQIWNPIHEESIRDRILRQHISPDFRLDRDPSNPVGGNGRESICFSEDLKVRVSNKLDQVEFMSVAVCTVLNEATLMDRNRDQVLSRHQKKLPRDRRILLTVPQLWIWKIEKRVITAMQKPIFYEFDRQVFDTITTCEDEILNALASTVSPEARPMLSGNLLAGILISECVSTLESPSGLGLSESVFEIFAMSIHELSAKLREYTKPEALTKNNIDRENAFVLQIDDVREELSMIQSVLDEQEKVWRHFIQAKFPEFWSAPPEGQFVIPSNLDELTLGVVEILGRPQTQFARYRRQIANMDKDAERVERHINLLLCLKSKHASLQEAHLTTLMSAAVIGFTIVTIIFTPLAFLSSLFALSTNQFQNNQFNSSLANGTPFYHSSYIGKWMVTIELASFLITGLAIGLALKFTTNFSILEFIKHTGHRAKQRFNGIKAWSTKETPQHTSNRQTTTIPARREEQPTVQKPPSAVQAVASSNGSQPIWIRFRKRPRKSPEENIESGNGP
ncbi:MAG: hypothetical protein Q9172_006495 [Xanthocarpia lactea]